MTRLSGYQKSFKKYGEDPRALQWKNEKASHVRYGQIVKDADLEGKTILDVGCGFGDIIPFIKNKARKIDYTGVDVTPEFIKIARQKYPGNKFIVGDYFKNPPAKKFDIVITSGTLNFNTLNPYIKREQMIKTLWSSTRGVLIFNMAGGYPQPLNKPKNRVFYADSLKILKFCFSLTNKIILRHAYHKKDFTLILYR